MKVHWIIENFVKEKSYLDLKESVKKIGYPLIEIDSDYKKEILNPVLNPLMDGRISPYDEPRNCVIVNGSIKMVKLIKESLDGHCSPICYCNFEKFKCSSYYSYFGSYLFNDKYCLMPLAELNRQKFDVWGHYGKESLIFIRPDSGEKLFQAGLLDFLDLSTFLDNHEDCKHDLVLISTPKNIKWEGRIIVSKYKDIIAHSTYRFQGQITNISAIPEGAKKLVYELLNIEYYPDSVFCYDICEDNDGKFWLLELTSFSSAGLYACNKKDIVEKVSEIAWKDFIS